jgi:glycosyltransferase involved in cell wall biosynthesis
MIIVYCTTSIYNSREANFIQVSQMISAFREAGVKVLSIYKRNKDLQNKTNESGLYLLYYHSSRLGHYFYLFYATLLTLIISYRVNSDAIYTRSVTIAFLLSIFYKKNILMEIHSSFPNSLEKYFANYASRKGIIFICISHGLVQYVKNIIPTAICYLEPDAHSVKLEKINNLYNYYNSWRDDYRPNVGYFGSMSPQKGEKLIKDIINLCDKNFYHVYTLNQFTIESKNLLESGQLSHSECVEKMKQMDFLLLTIVPQYSKRDISSYTSPLKLFEYSASGRVIIASDVPALREIVTDKEVLFCPNDANSFCKSIQELSHNSIQRAKMSRSLLKFSKNRTWHSRAKRIVNIIDHMLIK